MRALWRSDEMGRGESEGDVSAKLSSSAGMNAQLRRWTPCAASDCAQQAAGGEWQHMNEAQNLSGVVAVSRLA